MEIHFEDQGPIKIVELDGDLDGNTAPQLQDVIEQKVTEESRCLIIDMKKCGFVSSAGLRVLLISAKLMRNNEGMVSLTGLSEEVKDVMEMTGFEPYFEYHDSVDECCTVFGDKQS
jgi:anti-anti-sigma factor